MDKKESKLDEQQVPNFPGYFIKVEHWVMPKNKLEKEIQDYFFKTQNGQFLPADRLEDFKETQNKLIEWCNLKHTACRKKAKVSCWNSEQIGHVHTVILDMEFMRVVVYQMKGTWGQLDPIQAS
jgi:hypothetical protein